MHERNIELLREESRRLLQVEIDLLQRMKEAQGVVVEEHAHEHQTFSSASIDKDLKMLNGELSKLERLEMVLAVVGTMKAGKSTTINAIVGTEVLPNRNRPMTALPTRIRHTPGKKEPELVLDNNGPVNELVELIRRSLAKAAGKAFAALDTHDKDMRALLRFIEEKRTFEHRYHGPEEIFWFLKSLNDLVRLSQELDLDFPFDSYASIDDVPVIEVEFAHLANLPGGVGSLTLLDTPGPNEAGQVHLRPMLHEQLKNASAVLAVLDFTQLKSDADHQVREALESIADVAQGRMFALVNKFDEKDRNSDGEEQTRKLVADSLLKGRLDVSQVFPVSSKLGDLANRAQRELASNGRLPEVQGEENAWVEDFGKVALGTMWKMGVSNPDMVRQAADMLWEASLFAAPLNNVIRKAHSEAATLAIASAAAKLVDISARLNNFLDVREVALGKSADELVAQINSLRSDIARIEGLERQSQVVAEDALTLIKKKMDTAFADIQTEINQEIAHGLKAGKETEKQQTMAKSTEQKPTGSGFLSSLLQISQMLAGSQTQGKGKSRKPFNDEIDPNNPIISLDSKADAEKIIKDIESGVQSIIGSKEKALVKVSDKILTEFRTQFEQDIVRQASTIIGELNQRLNGNGFAIDVRLPSTQTLSLRKGGAESLNDIIEQKQRTETRRRRTDSVWGKLCGLFNTDDWGWESYSTTVGYYELDIKKVQKSINKTVKALFEDLAKDMVTNIETPLKEGVAQFFDELKLAVESLRSDLAQSIRDKQTSQEQQKALAERLAGFKRQVPGLRHDSEALRRDVQPETGEVSA